MTAKQDLNCIVACARSPASRERLIAAVDLARRKIIDFPEIGIERGAPGERHFIIPGLLVVIYRIARSGEIEVSRIHRAGNDYPAG